MSNRFKVGDMVRLRLFYFQNGLNRFKVEDPTTKMVPARIRNRVRTIVGIDPTYKYPIEAEWNGYVGRFAESDLELVE